MKDVHVNLDGGLGQRWLPAGYSYQVASLTATLDGPWKAPTHRGELAVTNLTVPSLEPLGGSLRWSGNGFTQAEAAVSLATTNGAANVRFTLQRSDQRISAELSDIQLLTNGVPLLALERPTSVSCCRVRTTHGPCTWMSCALGRPRAGWSLPQACDGRMKDRYC